MVIKWFCENFNYLINKNTPYLESFRHKEHFNRCLNDNVLVFVHPFYHEMGGASIALTDYYHDYKSLLFNLMGVSGWSKAWFTFPLVYDEGRNLLENGFFTKAFFTEFGSGNPLIPSELDEFKSKNFVLLGCYADQCIDDLVRSFKDRNIKDVSVLCEGVLFSSRGPEGIIRSNDYLFNRYVSDGIISKVNVVHLSDLIV